MFRIYRYIIRREDRLNSNWLLCCSEELKSSLRILTVGSPKSMLTLQDQIETSQIQTVLFYELLSLKPSHTQVLNSNPGLSLSLDYGGVLKYEASWRMRERWADLEPVLSFCFIPVSSVLAHLWFTDKGDCVHLPTLIFLRVSVLCFRLPLCQFLEGPLLTWGNW